MRELVSCFRQSQQQLPASQLLVRGPAVMAVTSRHMQTSSGTVVDPEDLYSGACCRCSTQPDLHRLLQQEKILGLQHCRWEGCRDHCVCHGDCHQHQPAAMGTRPAAGCVRGWAIVPSPLTGAVKSCGVQQVEQSAARRWPSCPRGWQHTTAVVSAGPVPPHSPSYCSPCSTNPTASRLITTTMLGVCHVSSRAGHPLPLGHARRCWHDRP